MRRSRRPAKEGMLEKAMDGVVIKIMKLQESSDSIINAMDGMELDERMMQMEETLATAVTKG